MNEGCQKGLLVRLKTQEPNDTQVVATYYCTMLYSGGIIIMMMLFSSMIVVQVQYCTWSCTPSVVLPGTVPASSSSCTPISKKQREGVNDP